MITHYYYKYFLTSEQWNSHTINQFYFGGVCSMSKTRFCMFLIVMLLSFALVGVALASDQDYIYPRLQPILDTSFKLAPAHVNQGDPIHYSVVIHNTGLDPALSTTLTDVLPNGTTYVPGSLRCDSGSCSYDTGTNTVSWFGEVGPAGPQNHHGNGVDDISGSTVNYINPNFFTPQGGTSDLCFNVTLSSPDFEYLDGFDFDLPNSWTVNSVTDVPGNGCGFGHTFGVNPGNVVYWYTNNMPSGCGDWSPGTYNFCANITVPAGCTVGWDFPWNITGDGWGELPHKVSGTATATCGEPPAPNPVTIQFDAIPNSCNVTIVNTAQIDDPQIPAPVNVSASTDVDCPTAPIISVSPLALVQSLAPDRQASQPLNVCNYGNDNLTWYIQEDSGASHVQNVLYDNGPMVTHPGGGSGGADASAVQTTLGLSSYGFGHQYPIGYWVADDFVISDPRGWDVTSFKFFAYQTDSGITSTITGVYYQVLNGAPDAGGTVVCGDMVTNRLTSTAFSNIYRVLDNALTNIQRPIMADTASVAPGCEHLATGTYWIMWSTDGTLTSGPWAPPISILGQVTTGNGLQSLDSGVSWDPLLDYGTNTQQGLPFIIEGALIGYDIPWLSENPTTGTILPADCRVVAVTFNSASLSLRPYMGVLLVNSNDASHPIVHIPVTLNVVSAYSIYLPLTQKH